ncbi:MAG: HAMP domain-containing protein [Anaerolineae bacterium]|nr:HAMP domain-containing protein [Anaerolineae bacterium]
MSDTRSFHLSIFARLLVVFLVISIYPISLLMVLSLGRARAIVSAPNPDVILDNLFIIEMFLLTVSVAAGVGMVYFVYQTISAPIARLGQMMERVVANDLNVRVVVNSNDEIGKLSDRFNDMVSGLQQREQLRILLNLYVSPQVAREALQHGAALGGQLVTCAVLFSDIRGFTSLSEQLSPEHLIRLLNRYMTVMVETIVAHDGMVNKFGGDSLLAVFGTPLNPNPNYAVDAVCAGLAMQRALECFNEEQRAEGGPEIKAGIGIASGPVVAGNVGGESRIEYTVIGDTVNLASRLQSMTKELGVAFLVDETTVEQVGSQATLQFEALAPLAVRGKHGVVKIYTVRSREKGG